VIVKVRFLKWGDGLVLPIPAAFAKEIRASANKPADMTVQDSALVVRVRKRKRRRYSLEELLEGITPDTYHGEIDWAQPVGNEDW
jgi:antitoxin MazE